MCEGTGWVPALHFLRLPAGAWGVASPLLQCPVSTPGRREPGHLQTQPPPASLPLGNQNRVVHFRNEYSLKSYNRDLWLHSRGIKGINKPWV